MLLIPLSGKLCTVSAVLSRLVSVDLQAEEDMASMQTVINLGRFAREKRSISLKTPVKGITVVCKDEGTLKALEKLQAYITGELNAWEVGKCSILSQECRVACGRWLIIH